MTVLSDKTDDARAAGYAMPAEWAPHERTWMIWPCRREVWGEFYDGTCVDYARVARTIAKYEPVTMIVNPADVAAAREQLGAAVEILELPADDSWARDCGPNFLLNAQGHLAGSSFTFNAWGGKYSPYDRDAALGGHILEHCAVPCFPSVLTAEGGGISTDGEGTVLTTESCFPNANRNPGWSRDEIEAHLLRSLGAEKVIWLPGNPEETETDGHVDGVAVFVAPGKVLVEVSGDPTNPFYDQQRANLAALIGQRDARGRLLEVISIEDAWGADELGERFCLSYINFYLVNGALIMPGYGVAADARAKACLQTLFPDRVIEQLRIDNIALGGGGIHCITQQQPRAGQ